MKEANENERVESQDETFQRSRTVWSSRVFGCRWRRFDLVRDVGPTCSGPAETGGRCISGGYGGGGDAALPAAFGSAEWESGGLSLVESGVGRYTRPAAGGEFPYSITPAWLRGELFRE